MGFILFLAVFVSLYSSLHFYGLMRLKGALALSPRTTGVVLVFMIIMVVAPIVVRLLERNNLALIARGLAYVAFSWMALLFVFCSIALLLDVYRWVVMLVQRISGAQLALITITARQCFLTALTVSSAIIVFGMVDATRIRTERVTLHTPKLAPEQGVLRIAQISDVHLGLIVGRDRLGRILARVDAAQPDILVSTGDLVDGPLENVAELAEMFAKIPTRLGKYAVTGNHEFYTGLRQAVQVTETLGFKMLRGESITLADTLHIAGVDDPTGRASNPSGKNNESQMLSQLAPQYFTVLLKHRPWVNPSSQGLFDLQLSGHTHKGQIFPFNLIVERFYPYLSGLITLDKDSLLYVNRGSGTWGPPVRFLAPPEVTLIELVPEKGANTLNPPSG